MKDNSITTPIGGSSDGYSPLQMAAAYVPFSNGGYYATPKAIKKVYDSEGTEIKSFSTDDRKRVIKESTAYIMTSMLRNVVNGSAAYARISGADMAVKTGTTTFGEAEAQKYGFDINNYSKDSWTIGYTSNYTLAVWQGFDAIDGPMLYRVNMQNIVRIHPPKGFNVPGNVGSIDGGVRVISDSERRQIEEQQRRAQEERTRSENNNSDNNNDSNTTNNRNNNSNINDNTASYNRSNRNNNNNSNNG